MDLASSSSSSSWPLHPHSIELFHFFNYIRVDDGYEYVHDDQGDDDDGDCDCVSRVEQVAVNGHEQVTTRGMREKRDIRRDTGPSTNQLHPMQ